MSLEPVPHQLAITGWGTAQVEPMETATVQAAAVTRASEGQLRDSAAQLVRSVSQPDDSGASTADRYDWQAAMAAADALALYLDGIGENGHLQSNRTDEVLCEWHEDWVIIRGESAVLVSGKHRDLGSGAYTTIGKLADEGGLAHLIDRWAALDEQAQCRLVTSGGLSSGPPQDLLAAARYFASQTADGQPVVVHTNHAKVVSDLRKAIAKYNDRTRERWSHIALSTDQAAQQCDAEVARFLAALTIVEGQPQRDIIGFAAPAMYVQPILDRLSAVGSPVAIWEAVVGLFRVRMRSRGPLPTGGLPPINDVPQRQDQISHETERALAARTVTLGDIETAISTALASPGGYEPIPRAPRRSRLEAKMSVERCSDNSIERALALRTDYQEYWRDRTSTEPVARAERRRFERLLHRITDSATGVPAVTGPIFWRQLQIAVDNLPQEMIPAGMDVELVLGGVCDLTGRCKVWFGPRFDVEAFIARHRVRGEGEDQT